MQMWLFFTIFGLTLFVPSIILFLILNRFRNTINLLLKINGTLKRVVITNKDLEVGQITAINGKKIKPIKISKDEIYTGTWRRWIIKSELDSKSQVLTDKEIEEYLNNEDLIKLYLAGKFKDTLIMLLTIIIILVIGAAIVNGYLINSKQCIIAPTNETTQYISSIVTEAYYAVLSGNLSMPVS
jgi:hypothetical protein